MTNIVVSQKGVSFTIEALETMRQFAITLRRDNQEAVVWSIDFNTKDQPVSTLCGDYSPQPGAIADQIEELPFYWYTDERGLNMVRNLCVDVGWGRRSRLLPLEGLHTS